MSERAVISDRLGTAGQCLLMAWARIDDAFDDHPKVLALLEHEQGGAAIGLWTLCLTWAHRNTLRKGKTPGLIAASLPRRYLGPGARELAALLVKEGLWEPRDEGDGWLIHDFAQYLPAPKTREARAAAGRKGAAKRWGDSGREPGNRGKLPSGQGNEPGASHEPASKTMTSDGSRAPARRAISNEIAPVPEPVPEPGSKGSVVGGPGGDAPQTAAPKRRGTRIPDNFPVTAEMVAWARERCPHVDGKRETEKFINHFQAKSGREAVKLDWVLTWKNWMLTAAERTGRPPPGGTSSQVSPREEHMRRR